MAIGPDRIQVLKQESAALGGDGSEDVPYPSPIDAQEDAIECAGVYVQDASNRDENVYIARAGNDLIFRDSSNPTPKTLTDLLAGGGGGVFGSSYSFGSSEPSSSTSSNTYQQKLKLTAATAAGTYVVFWQALITTSSANKNFQARIQVDDATTLMEIQSRVAVATQDYIFSGIAQVTLTAASHDFDIDYSSTSASSTSIEKARIVIWRIS